MAFSEPKQMIIGREINRTSPIVDRRSGARLLTQLMRFIDHSNDRLLGDGAVHLRHNPPLCARTDNPHH